MTAVWSFEHIEHGPSSLLDEADVQEDELDEEVEAEEAGKSTEQLLVLANARRVWKRLELAEPCAPAALSVFQTLAFLGGVIGAIIAILALNNESMFGGDVQILMLGWFLLSAGIYGAWWYRRWKAGKVFD